MASREVATRLRLAGPRWSTLLAGLRHPRRFFSELVERIQEDNILTIAAAMSYFFFFAFFPFLLFLLALVSLLPVHGLEDWLLAQGSQVFPGEAYGMLERTVRGLLALPKRGLLSLGAVIVLLFWLYLLAFFLLLGGEVNALLEHLSPAGKMEGEREAAPVEIQAERIARAGGSG